MTTETILADEQINEAWSNNLTGMFMSGDQMRKFARAIEQAVLQSPEIEALRKDAARLQYLIDQKAFVKTDPDNVGDVFWLEFPCEWEGQGGVQIGMYPTPRAAIDAAMEQQT